MRIRDVLEDADRAEFECLSGRMPARRDTAADERSQVTGLRTRCCVAMGGRACDADQVDHICRKYGLQYFLVHRSLLGGSADIIGFMPAWDDDWIGCSYAQNFDDLLYRAGRQQNYRSLLSVHILPQSSIYSGAGMGAIRQ